MVLLYVDNKRICSPFPFFSLEKLSWALTQFHYSLNFLHETALFPSGTQQYVHGYLHTFSLILVQLVAFWGNKLMYYFFFPVILSFFLNAMKVTQMQTYDTRVNSGGSKIWVRSNSLWSHLDIRNNFFSERPVKHWHRLPREAVVTLPGGAKNCGDLALRAMAQWAWGKDGLGHLGGHFQPQWFCDTMSIRHYTYHRPVGSQKEHLAVLLKQTGCFEPLLFILPLWMLHFHDLLVKTHHSQHTSGKTYSSALRISSASSPSLLGTTDINWQF